MMWMGMKRALLLCLILGFLIGSWCVTAQAQGGGEDWTKPLNLSQTQQSSDSPLIISDSGGTVHVFWSEDVKGELLWEERAPLLGGTAIFYTRWDGTSWTVPVDILTSPTGAAVGPDGAVVDSEGRLYLTFGNHCSWAPSSDADSSPAWASPVAFAPAVYDSKITIDRAGHLHIVYAQRYPDGIYHTSSTDGGRTWSDAVRISSRFVEEATRHERVALALDGRGRLHVGWIQRGGEAFDETSVWYAQSTDGGQTWTKPLKVAERGPNEFVNDWVHVIARGEDEIHLVWVGGQANRLHQWSSDGGQTWSGPFHILGDLYAVAGGDGFAIDGAGTLHMVTQLRYPGALWHAYGMEQSGPIQLPST
ncbi:MAG: hypothetical protein H8E47_05520 [Anaerolineales bacterium]|nr:hypothetical protein [Anaerolineales bacterium]